MMEEAKDLVGWFIGLMLALFTAIFGFFKWLKGEFGTRDTRLSSLQEKVSSLETEIKLEIASLNQKITLNAERDRSNQELILAQIRSIAKKQEEQSEIMKEWQKNIENFYYQNPQLSKPDSK